MIWQKNKRLDVIYSVSLHPNSLNSMMTSYLVRDGPEKRSYPLVIEV